MGIIRNGGNGAFSGKAGSFIGSNWKDISYMKGIPKLSNKPASQKQLDQRSKFATVLQYLAPIKDLLNVSFKGQTSNRATGFNMAIQYALANALTGTYPDYAIDPSKVIVSKGTVEPPSDLLLNVTSPGKIYVSWLGKVNKYNGRVDDNLHFLLYNRERKLFMTFDPIGLRGEEGAELNIPFNYTGQTVDAYAFFQTLDESRCSASIYVGEFTLG